jgi:mannosidase alpha-like ER degradation enhancer 1
MRHVHGFQAYRAILQFMKNDHWYVDVDMETGRPSRNWVDSFQAFFPSLMVQHYPLNLLSLCACVSSATDSPDLAFVQVLAGDIENATHMYAAYHSMWQHYGFVPELYLHSTQELRQANYPLRPELPESTWYQFVHLQNNNGGLTATCAQ